MEGGEKRSSRSLTDKEKKSVKERERKSRMRKQKQRREAEGAPAGGRDMTKLGMPIDPHEPRYCYCHQVSWGEVGAFKVIYVVLSCSFLSIDDRMRQ